MTFDLMTWFINTF